MNKLLIAAISISLLLYGGYHGYNYINAPKIVDGVVSKNIDTKGNPVEVTTEFSAKDTVYFSSKVNRFWIKKAQVVWYKGEIATANRFLVQENVTLNEAGYFSAKLSIPEGLEAGHYGVTIYAAGNDVIETHAEFDIKK